MLVADPADRDAITRVRHLMLGGEALPTALAADIRALLPDRFTNMYGPTETTIWSLIQEIPAEPTGAVPIGTPIANTTIFVLDPDGRRLPVGAFGELHIGGDGVARGYHNRPELTAERFVDRPGMGRVYATGDVVRIHPDGYVEFAGRSDNQVKIRGHRIELGEIEAVLDRHPDVVQSVVVARDDKRRHAASSATSILHHGTDVTSDALRKHVAEVLPEAMVPSVVAAARRLPADAERQDRPQGAARRHRLRQRRRPGRPPRRRPTTPSASSPTSGRPSWSVRSAGTTTSSRSAGTRCWPSRCSAASPTPPPPRWRSPTSSASRPCGRSPPTSARCREAPTWRARRRSPPRRRAPTEARCGDARCRAGGQEDHE